MSLNMLPAIAADDLSNVSTPKAKVLSDDPLQNAGCGLSFDLSGDCLRDLGSWMGFSSPESFWMKMRRVDIAAQQPLRMGPSAAPIICRPAPFGVHIIEIGLLSADPEMPTSGVEHTFDFVGALVVVTDASANVTNMTDQQPVRNGPCYLNPGVLMCAISGAAEMEDTIAPVADFAGPIPACAVFRSVLWYGACPINVETESFIAPGRQAGSIGSVHPIASTAAIEADAESDLLSRGKEAGPAQAADAWRGTLDRHRDHPSVSAPALAGVRGRLLQGFYHNA